ncbi:hypothetical protein EDC52_10712 [Biostraticola tofi]|uniref:Uncharacterized protein n=2 Tax=Biostraticola tofi TaxID=466109 RepID=A0A4R3YPP8_9GAMM|nr:hypothetical protein EDC52_10712 [Biostraticola tofi]
MPLHDNTWAHLVFEWDPQARDAAAGTVLIGLGDSNDDRQSSGVALNHKGYRQAQYGSVSELIVRADQQQWARWRQKLPDPQHLQRVIIEDFSPDTCLALLLFLQHLEPAGTAPPLSEPWLAYISAWESGIYLDGDTVERSAACLLSALGHAYLPEHTSTNNSWVREGLINCLALLAAMMEANPQPTAGIEPLHTRQYSQAVASLGYERQLYRQVLQRALTCQLLVDLADGRRQTVVDALFINEASPSGMLKILARTDRQHTWTRNGFGLLAIYRPQEAGSGNDMVVSLDPVQGTRLDALWHRLEQRENDAWHGLRPRETPRFLESYRLPGSHQLRPEAPTQPWYDDQGRHTLIAAPKRLPTGEPGTRLDWHNDILPAVWECYFSRYLPPAIVPFSVPALAGRTGGKSIRVFRHHQAALADPSIDPMMRMIDTPTFHAWLAANSNPALVVKSPADLPAADSYHSAWYGDILAVSHRHGVTLYCRQDDQAQLDILLGATVAVADASQAYDSFLTRSSQQLDDWLNDLLESQQSGYRQGKIRHLSQWTEMILHTKAQALKAVNHSSLLGSDALHNRLTENLSCQWGLSEQRRALIEQIDRLDELMRQAIAKRQEKRQRVYGALFSALGLGVAANHIWQPIKEIKTVNLYEWQLMMFKENPGPSLEDMQAIAADAAQYEIYTLVILLVFGFIGFVLFWFFDVSAKEE